MSEYKRLPMVYIAGPFRGANAWEVEQNIRRAEEMAFRVSELGASVLCPHSNTRFFNGTLTDEYWLAATREAMRRCDAVVMCDGWRNSDGSRGERREAIDRGLAVFYHNDLDNLAEWVREWTPDREEFVEELQAEIARLREQCGRFDGCAQSEEWVNTIPDKIYTYPARRAHLELPSSARRVPGEEATQEQVDLVGQLYDARHEIAQLRAERDRLWSELDEMTTRAKSLTDDRQSFVDSFDKASAMIVDELRAELDARRVPADLPNAEELARVRQDWLSENCNSTKFDSLSASPRGDGIAAMSAVLDHLRPWLRDRLPADLPSAEELARVMRKVQVPEEIFSWQRSAEAVLDHLRPWLRDWQACGECENRRSVLAKAMGSWFCCDETDEENIQRIMREVRRDRQAVDPESWREPLVMDCCIDKHDRTTIKKHSISDRVLLQVWRDEFMQGASTHTPADAARAAVWLASFAEAHGEATT